MKNKPQVSITDWSGHLPEPGMETENLRQKVIAEFAELVARSREAFYWKMIANGWLPSQGWQIGERIITDNPLRMGVHHFAIPPRIKP